MALSLRTGSKGLYYGDSQSTSHSLSSFQAKINAQYIFNYLIDKGWSINAICGLLGNLENESAINPGRWQSEDVGNMSGGYGLCQWTPAKNYINWAKNRGYDWSTMDSNLKRILYELENGLQFYKTPSYPLTFKQFTQSKESPYYLACAFAWNYERSWVVLYGSESQKENLRKNRGGDANKWYEYLIGESPGDIPDPPTPPTPSTKGKKKNKFKFILFNRN